MQRPSHSGIKSARDRFGSKRYNVVQVFPIIELFGPFTGPTYAQNKS